MNARNALKLPLICLTAIVLSGCALFPGAPEFPTTRVIEYDALFGACGEYKIVDFQNFKYEYVKEIPCESVFGFSAEDTPKVMDWLSDIQDYAKQHCQ